MPVHICSAVKDSVVCIAQKRKKKESAVHQKWILKKYPVFVSPIDAWDSFGEIVFASIKLLTITLDPELFNNIFEG